MTRNVAGLGGGQNFREEIVTIKRTQLHRNHAWAAGGGAAPF